MSLLHRGTETVVVYPEEAYIDADGNTITRASAAGVVVKAVVQPITSAVATGGSEKQETGFFTEAKYRLRLAGYPGVLGAQSQVDWDGKRWCIEGEPRKYNGSRRTAHIDYVISRS